jgi:hypothetical protein
MSKGSNPRPYNKKKFDQEYDRIFGSHTHEKKEENDRFISRDN